MERGNHISASSPTPCFGWAGKTKQEKYRNYPKWVLREATGTALKSHGKREVLVLSIWEQLFTGIIASDGSRRVYNPPVPTLQAGTQTGMGREAKPYPRKTDKIILAEKFPKCCWWLRQEDMQQSHHHRSAEGSRSPGTSLAGTSPPKGSG